MTFDEFIKDTFAGEKVDLATVGMLRWAWNAGVEAEREACAKVAEEGMIGHTIAKAIRARGE